MQQPTKAERRAETDPRLRVGHQRRVWRPHAKPHQPFGISDECDTDGQGEDGWRERVAHQQSDQAVDAKPNPAGLVHPHHGGAENEDGRVKLQQHIQKPKMGQWKFWKCRPGRRRRGGPMTPSAEVAAQAAITKMAANTNGQPNTSGSAMRFSLSLMKAPAPRRARQMEIGQESWTQQNRRECTHGGCRHLIRTPRRRGRRQRDAIHPARP